MRDENILSIRPTLDLNVEGSNEIETFQNETIRPILKLQDPITARLLASSAHFTQLSEKIDKGDKKKYHEIITKYLSSNIFFKNKIIGCVIGLMTSKELAFYEENTSEINKRIVAMQIQRYAD